MTPAVRVVLVASAKDDVNNHTSNNVSNPEFADGAFRQAFRANPDRWCLGSMTRQISPATLRHFPHPQHNSRPVANFYGQ